MGYLSCVECGYGRISRNWWIFRGLLVPSNYREVQVGRTLDD